jgi:hypothetical protein
VQAQAQQEEAKKVQEEGEAAADLKRSPSW